MNDSDNEKKKTEMIKLVFDLLKHVTTLSSGSILLILAISEKIFVGKNFPKLLLIAPCLFIISIVAALMSMVVISFMSGQKKTSMIELAIFSWGFVVSALAFAIGMFFILAVLLTAYG